MKKVLLMLLLTLLLREQSLRDSRFTNLYACFAESLQASSPIL